MVRMIRPPPMREPSRDPTGFAGRPRLGAGYHPALYRMAWTPPPTEPIPNLDQISQPRLQCCSHRRLTAIRRQAVRALRRSLTRRGNPGECRNEDVVVAHISACRTKGTEAYSTPIYGVLVRRQPQIFRCWSPGRGFVRQADLCMDWNSHVRFPGLAGDGHGAYSIGLAGNQIA